MSGLVFLMGRVGCERCPLTLTLFLTGPYGANIFNPHSRGHSSGLNSEEPINFITLEFTCIVLAIGVFMVGVKLPKAYMIKH